MGGRALVIAAVAACGSRAALDQPVPQDAGPFIACDDDAQSGVRVQGFVGELEPGCVPTPSQNPQVCWLGHSTCWVPQGLGPSDYTLYGLPNEEIILRTTTDSNVPRLEAIHPFGCSLLTYGFVLPTPTFTAQLLAPVGGFDVNKAYLIVFAEVKNAGVCSGDLAGVSVTSDAGAVYYLNATATALDASLVQTSTTGLAVVVLDQAPVLGSDPLVVRVSAHRATSTPSCRMLTGVQWQRGDVTSQTDFVADAPALAGHFTYAMYISCSAK